MVIACGAWMAGVLGAACGDRTSLETNALDAGSDATAPVDAGSVFNDAPDVARDAGTDAVPLCVLAGACTGAFPKFDDHCAAIDDCVLAQHTVDCCGSRVALGVRASQKAAFDTAEAKWRATLCQETCDCKQSPLCDDVGHICATSSATLECSSGRCRTVCAR